jgi:geranylgeranyl pyrophosphate synthase
MNKYIEIINNSISKHLIQYFEKDDPMIEICLYSLQDGKKIRPSITLDICYSLLNCIENAEFPSLLAEYIHTSSLLIDD